MNECTLTKKYSSRINNLTRNRELRVAKILEYFLRLINFFFFDKVQQTHDHLQIELA